MGRAGQGLVRAAGQICPVETQLTPSFKEGDVREMLLRDCETASIEPPASDSPKEELRPPS